MYKVVGLTDKGLVKTQNEDHILINKNIHNDGVFSVLLEDDNILLAVADGVSGEEGGEYASRMALEIIQELAGKDPKEVDRIKERVYYAHEKILQVGNYLKLEKMATTITAVMISPEKTTIFNLGDTRVYLYKFNAVRQLSTDHTLYHELTKMGVMDVELEKMINKHQITRYLGGSAKCPAVDVKENLGQLKNDNMLLLCSDGLTDMVTNLEIEDILNEETEMEEKIVKLKEKAYERGAYDNISIILVRRA